MMLIVTYIAAKNGAEEVGEDGDEESEEPQDEPI